MSFVLTKEIVNNGLENVQDFIDTLFTEKYCQDGETTKQDVLNRVANIVEQKGKEFGYDKIKEYSLKEAADLIRNEYFIPGGSILAGLGKKDSKSSLSNCYVVPIENDSIEAIWDAAGKMARTYSYRGGCGTDITVLRPANTPVHNAAKSSSGAVSFMPFLSTTTKTIGQCLAYDSLVLTKHGLKEIQYVNIGDEVWTAKGWIKVLNVLKNKKQTYELKTSFGYSVRASEDHVFQTVENFNIIEKPLKNFTVNEPIILLTGTNIKKEEFNYIPLTHNNFKCKTVDVINQHGFCGTRKQNSYQTVTIPKILDEKLAYVLGFSYGNGYVEYDSQTQEPKSIELSCGHKYPIIEQKVKEYIKDVFQRDSAVNKVSMGGIEICTFLKENELLKEKTKDIKIPLKIINSSQSVQCAFLSGIFDADGYAPGSKCGYRFSTISIQMAKGIQTLLMSLGIISKIHTDDRSHKKWNDLYAITVTGKYSTAKFIKYFHESIRMQRINYIANSDSYVTPFTSRSLYQLYNSGSSDWKNEKYVYVDSFHCFDSDVYKSMLVQDEIQSIEKSEIIDTYDLSLESEHLFWCNGFYVHNSGRRGALLISIDCRHPDVMSFIWSKADPHRVFPIDALDMEIPSVSRANISVKLTDEFMQAVKDDKPWYCLFPDIDADKDLYNKEWDGDYEKWLEMGGKLKRYDTYQAIITEENRHRFVGQILCILNSEENRFNLYKLVSNEEYIRLTYHPDEIGDIIIDHINTLEVGKEYTFQIPTAKQIMQNMAEAACMRGDPGVMFIDHMQNNTYGTKVSPETKIKTTNPCVPGFTPFLTENGYLPIATTINNPISTWNGSEWVEVIPRITGYDQPIFKLTFSNGMEIFCTEYHEFETVEGDVIEAINLTNDHRLYKGSFPVITTGNHFDNAQLYTQGVYSGDGFLECNKPHVILYEEKIKLKEYFNEHHCIGNDVSRYNNRQWIVLDNLLSHDKTFIPMYNYSLQNRLHWLAGLIDTDGTILKDGSIQISSINKDFLYSTILMLQTMGCSATLSLSHKAKLKLLPDSQRNLKEYQCQDCWRINISGMYSHRLFELGLPTKRIQFSYTPSREASQHIRLTNREYVGIASKVYCFTEPNKHRGMFNGILTRQCGELALPAWNSCLLGAHVLSKYVINPWDNDAYLDMELFQKNTQLAVVLMDIFSEINQELHPLENQRYFDKRTRRLGIEFLGLADMISMLRINIDDEHTYNRISDIMKFKAYLELIASNTLAKYLKAPEILNPIKNKKGIIDLLKSEYIKNIFFDTQSDRPHLHNALESVCPIDRLIENIKKYGLRNIGLNTVGPTGSLALICNNASSGIEPIFSLYQKRRTRVGNKPEYELVHAPLMQHLKNRYSNELETKGFTLQELKERFYIREAYEIDYKDRIELQSVVQRWTDGSISSTVNLPETCTIDDIVNIYTYAWDKKLKGITVYKAGSLTGVIETKTTDTKSNDIDTNQYSLKSDMIPVIRELSDVERCRRHRVIWNKTKIYITVTIDNNDAPIEVFAALPKEVGIDENDVFSSQSYQEKDSLWTAVCRLVSLALRARLPLEEIIKQLQKSSYVLNDPMAILIRVLSIYTQVFTTKEEFKQMTLTEINQNDCTSLCPKCNQKTYVREAGCAICYNPECKYTKCS